jgi:hypothetical protein
VQCGIGGTEAASLTVTKATVNVFQQLNVGGTIQVANSGNIGALGNGGNAPVYFGGGAGALPTDVATYIGSTYGSVDAVDPNSILLAVSTNITNASTAPVATINAAGTLELNSGALPGAAVSSSVTVNACKGRVSIPSGTNTVTVENDQVTENSVVLIEWENDPGGWHYVTVNTEAPGFEVHLVAEELPASDLPFRFVVIQ